MSFAPDSLRALRRYLVDKTGKPTENFGIRGTVGAKRVQGYHLGESDIYGPGGLGDSDYSVRRPRDKRGLTDAASGFDIKLPLAALKELREFLVSEARNGRAPDVVEIIGPGNDGRAYVWRKPDWVRLGPRPAGDSHEWHIHVSYHRDGEYRDKVALYEPYYGPRSPAQELEVEPDPVEDEGLEPEPVDDLTAALERVSDLEDMLAMVRAQVCGP